MHNVRVIVIIGMLMAVLLSAFAAERLRVCRGERHCLVESTPGLLPAARFFMVRSANRPGAAQSQTETQPQPTAITPSLDPAAIAPVHRREAEALP